MANREALRELQHRLAERMQAAKREQRGQSWLAVECRGHGLLLPLEQAGEIFAPTALMPVPHTREWFAGVANLRGGRTAWSTWRASSACPTAPTAVASSRA
jgi:twitching motility protein PilI